MDSDLIFRLNKISKVFDIPKIIGKNINKLEIKKYYYINKIPYTLFHSRNHFIHLGITYGNKFSKTDLLEPVKFVDKYIRNNSNFKVLELATGRGANCKYLATSKPRARFVGLDLSPVQLGYAKKVARKLKNYKCLEKDFHNLNDFNKNTFDLIFVIESLCYSTNRDVVFNECYRVLKPGGKLITIDAYLTKKNLTKQQRIAFLLSTISMAIRDFTTYSMVKKIAYKHGFKVEFEENASTKVLPSMLRLEKYSRGFFKKLFLAKILHKFLPEEFTLNALTGYLLVPLTRSKITSYYLTVFTKT